MKSQRANPTFSSNHMNDILKNDSVDYVIRPTTTKTEKERTPPPTKSKRQQSPYKPFDQPINSFYHVQEKEATIRNANPKLDNQNNQYNLGKTTRIMNNQQRRQYDNTSEVFGNRQINNKVVSKTPEQLNINSKTLWSDVHIGNTKSKVNENAEFDREYAKQRKQAELQSENICRTDRVQAEILDEWDHVNSETKKKNQQFSDIFGQELGYKKQITKQINRSLSPNLQWNQFDSIRNMKDIKEQEKTPIKSYNDGQKSSLDTHNFEGIKQQPLSEPIIHCKISFDKIKGQYKQNFQDFRDSLQLGTERKMQQSQKHKYQGIYAWKKHYQK